MPEKSGFKLYHDQINCAIDYESLNIKKGIKDARKIKLKKCYYFDRDTENNLKKIMLSFDSFSS